MNGYDLDELIYECVDIKRVIVENDEFEHGERKLLNFGHTLAHAIEKYYNGAAETDDLISVGSIGLIKAINTFEYGKGTQLATYTARCIENEILMYLRKTSSQKTEISFDEPLNTDWDGNELLLSDILGTEADSVIRPLEDETDRELLLSALSSLPEKEQIIIKMRFGIGGESEKTQKEVADILGISQSYISRLEKRIISRLRSEILRLL